MFLQTLTAALCLLALSAQGKEEIVFSASSANAPPLVFFEREILVGGISKELGEAIAGQLGRQARFMVLPRKRIERYLEAGNVDAHCYSRPEWLPIPGLLWSRPVFPDSDLLISARSAPPARSVKDLHGETVGTVLGFRYRQLDEYPEVSIQRDDAPSMEHNLRKMAIGRFVYAFTNRLTLDYYLQIGDPRLSIHPPLVLFRYQTQCALSPKSRVSLSDFNLAIETLQKNGQIEKILGNYR